MQLPIVLAVILGVCVFDIQARGMWAGRGRQAGRDLKEADAFLDSSKTSHEDSIQSPGIRAEEKRALRRNPSFKMLMRAALRKEANKKNCRNALMAAFHDCTSGCSDKVTKIMDTCFKGKR